MATTRRKGRSSDRLANRAPTIIYSVTCYNRINVYSLASFCHISIDIIYLFIYLFIVQESIPARIQTESI